MSNPTHIDAHLYREIIELLPIVCIDIFAVRNGELLLGKRKNNPLKGQWCVPGGRMILGESFSQGIKRKIHEELGITYDGPEKLLGIYNTIFPINSFNEERTYHTVNIVYVIELPSGSNITPDTQNDQLSFFPIKANTDFPDYINSLIRDYQKSYGKNR